jgi:uncharacterized membrane protein YozB (DUF420 family)
VGWECDWVDRVVDRELTIESLDPKVLFWTGAFINMNVVVGLAIFGVKRLREGFPSRHRSLMITASLLVVGFILAYVLKLVFLGREDLSVWSQAAVWTLRFHETCVLTMVVGGALALRWGSQLSTTRSFTLNPEDPEADPALVNRHRRAGRTAVIGAALGLASSGFVLQGMYARLS